MELHKDVSLSGDNISHMANHPSMLEILIRYKGKL